MKKTVVITFIVILLLNLISINSFAEVSEDTPIDLTPQETGQVEIKNSDDKSTKTGITGSTYSGSQTFKIVVNTLTVIPQAINQLLDLFVETTTATSSVNRFTIYDTVLGHYDLFDIDYTNIPSSIKDKAPLIEKVKFYVMKYYNLTRNLSIVISLFVLIYIGIRMAISTVASDKAKYKKMLVDWIASVMLIFFIHLIVIGISFILQTGLTIVENIAKAWKVESFELDIYSGAINNLTANGFNVFTAVVLIYLLTWYQVKFFLYYLHRTLEVNFLIVVSPMVAVTYAIDKTGDNKAQAFGNFLKELIMKSGIQILHAVVYLVFLATAGVIAKTQPIIAIVFFAALSRAEKIARNIFGIDEKGFEQTQIPFV